MRQTNQHFDKLASVRETQGAMVRNLRAESCLDPRIPLALPPPQNRVESGPTVERYFRDKHRRGQIGKFFPLHLSSEPYWLSNPR